MNDRYISFRVNEKQRERLLEILDEQGVKKRQRSKWIRERLGIR